VKYDIIFPLIAGIIVTLTAYGDGGGGNSSFPPVSLESGNNTIRLSRVGTYSGDFFDLSSISPPTYDPVSKRIFIPMNDLGRVDVLDIRDPANPKKASSILTEQFGGGPNTVDAKNGILAVGLVNPIKTLPGTVVFFDVTGDRIGGPVVVGAQPALLAFTPDGQHVVVANEGEANDEYTIDPKGSISIIDIDSGGEDCHTQHCHLNLKVHTLDFDDYNDKRNELIAAGVRIYGPKASVAQDLEPESVAISPDSQTAWVVLQRNNAVAVVDIPNNKITTILPLGYKDHSLPGNGFDASDVDGKINIKTWPVRSFYEPDIFAPFQVNGTTYLVTANEGDPRDFKGYSELARVSELRLNLAAFPNAASLQSDSQLGRLHVTKVEGDTNNDGYVQIYMLGSRSFAIWTTDWQLVFDSGDQLEQIAAQAVPKFFNTADDETRFDQKSDERGPEPEELAVGQVDGRQYVFVAPERIGGIYVYDITDPKAPIFQQYINYRNFAIDPAAVCEKNQPKSDQCSQTGDLGPEGILFIAADQSPIGVPLVAITNEVSDSTTLYRVDSRQSYTLTVSTGGIGTGTVTSVPAGINCGGDCNKDYNSGTAITLTATPASGSVFTGWSGACNGTGTCQVTMDQARTVTATFNRIEALVIDFCPYGLWLRKSDQSWAELHDLCTVQLVAADLDGNGQTDLVINFGTSYGIWVWMNNQTWVQLHTLSPVTITAADLDGNGKADLAINFGTSYGIWVWMNNQTWVQLHTLSPVTITAADLDGNGQSDLVVNFGNPYGLWVWMNNQSWTQLHALSPASVTTARLDGNAQQDLIVDFAPYGLWKWMNNQMWVKLHDLPARSITAADLDGNGLDEVVIDFNPYGLWVWMNNQSWWQLHSLSPMSVTAAYLDNNAQQDLVVDFSPYGIWQWMNNQIWVKLHDLPAKHIIDSPDSLL
jgi:hypothetical protein